MNVALKEWHAVTRALESGRQIVLLRKGGIHEAGGEFEIEHRRFVLFPTWLHQKLDSIKPADRAGVEARTSEPDKIELRCCAAVTDILPITARAQIDAIDDEHIYLPPLIDMRFNYKPENPLYLLLVRTSRLREPVTIDNTMAYAGCKSWVPLEAPVELSGSTSVLDDARFESRRSEIMRRVSELR